MSPQVKNAVECLIEAMDAKTANRRLRNMFLIFASTEQGQEFIDDGVIMMLERFFDILDAIEDQNIIEK